MSTRTPVHAPRLLAAGLALASIAGSAPAQRGRPAELVPPGLRLVHGDILIPANHPVPEGASCSQTGTYLPVPWPDGVVPFTFAAGVTGSQKDAMRAAMDEWNYSGADLTFVPIEGPDAASLSSVTIQNSSGNNSSIGLLPPGLNVINVFNWDYEFIMAHELCHTLGFWHEQSRPDRDTFVTIQCGNVSQTDCSGGPCDSNFEKESGWLALNTGYDFDSVMHYDQCAFSTSSSCPQSGVTIQTTPAYAFWQSLMGQRDHLSLLDVLDVIDAYGSTPTGPRYVDPASTIPAGTLLLPYDSIALAEGVGSPSTGIWVKPGTYGEGPITLDAPNVWRAYPGGNSVVVR